MKKRANLIIVILAILFLIGVSSLVYRFFIWQPEAIWDESPDSVIIASDPGCIEMDIDYIPYVQIWGDGRIIWIEYNINGERTVWEGNLTHSEIKQLIERLIRMDFFKFWHGYNEYCAGKFLTVRLSDISSRRMIVSQNSKFVELYNFLATGAGTKGKEFVPTQGLLYAYPIEETELPADTEATFVWPEDEFGYNLEELYTQKNGRSISGEEIRFAWEIVNSPFAVVESNGKVYWIGIRLPGIST